MTPMPAAQTPFQVSNGRFELKFVAPPESTDWIISQLNMHPVLFKKAYPERRVNNVYFDTENLEAYADNLSGISRRIKVRYRWYGIDNVAQNGALEIKSRRNQLGWKMQHPIPGIKLLHGDGWRNAITALKKELPGEGKIWLDQFTRAVLINRYRRQYFISPDGNFRVTVDDDIRTYNQWLSGKINLRCRAEPMPDGVIVEVKFDQSQREKVSGILDTLSLRRSRHSKYMTGAEACFSL
ncbi:MAG: polyphosphate polymerase domain-containing protein [Rhodospirillales bacterium]|nr:polyphosphate polymerase domain-containing protein [Rhodospirillales bacterium]